MTESRRAQLTRVMIVEDQALLAANLEEMLADMGAETIVIAASVADARSQLEGAPFDLVLLDVQLGSESGLVIADVCSLHDIPVILSTGHGDAFKAAIKPSEVLLPKPYTWSTLSLAVEEVFRKKEDR